MKNRALAVFWAIGFIVVCILFPISMTIYVIWNINLFVITRDQSDYYLNIINNKITYYFQKSTSKHNDTPLRYVIYRADSVKHSMYCWTYDLEDAREIVSKLNQ